MRFKSGNSVQHTAEKAAAPDGFDDWARVRDERLGVFRNRPFFVGTVLIGDHTPLLRRHTGDRTRTGDKSAPASPKASLMSNRSHLELIAFVEG